MSSQNLQILQNASVLALEENFKDLIQFFPDKSWLSKNNRYTRDTIKKIYNDIKKKNISPKEINEYIAASVILHALDAWSYFGRSINSLFMGDISITKHLLYYSELRSGMAILAAQGIGVFDGKHFIINDSQQCEFFPSSRKKKCGTHQFVWDALDYWINYLNAATIILNMIKLENISLESWLSSFGINEGMKNAIITEWLQSIGFDLKLFRQDNNARNEVSYRPTTINGVVSFNYKRFLDEVIFCWNLCEPKSNYGLPKIDEIIISEFFYKFFEQTTEKKIEQKNIDLFSKSFEKSFDEIGITFERKKHWSHIVTNIKHINKVKEISDLVRLRDKTNTDYILGMLYRALFLLRVSVAFCEKLIKNSDVRKENLEFWWSQIGYNYGLWKDHNSIVYFGDLWEDVNDELEKLKNILSNSKEYSQYDIQNYSQISTAKLSSFERVHLWSIGL